MRKTWDAYHAIAERYRDRMTALVQRFDPEAGFEIMDDAQAYGQATRADGEVLGITFSIWDSGDADDGIYGVHGNFVFQLVETGGRMVGDIIPENYSSECWVNYSDLDEWDRRMEAIEASADSIADAIERWKGETDGTDE